MTDTADRPPPPRKRPADVTAYLRTEPRLEDVRAAFPDEWDAVQRDLQRVAAGRGSRDDYLRSLLAPAAPAGKGRVKRQEAAAAVTVKRYIARELMKGTALAAASGQTSGRVRFGLVDGWLMQRLLFERDLVRKPVSMRRFRMLWPLLRQRARLMPLVEPRGIYCFYSRQLVARLAEIVDGRRCVEIAAGDGTLSRFLRDAGVDVVATDDRSWSAVGAGEDVVEEDAVTALRTRSPEVVLCSWPPAGNAFEREVFATPSVQTYIVIGSSHALATGDHAAYASQTAFDAETPADLAALVLPPEIDPAVHVFRRRT